MAVLWLRFLTEIDEHTQQVPEELLENPDTRKALQILEKSAFTDGQLQAYSDFWMALVDERVLREDAQRKGHAEGHAKGLAEGLAEGHAKGLAEGRAEGLAEGLAKGRTEGRSEGREEGILETARKMKAKGYATEVIAEITGLSADEIEAL